MKKSKVIAIAVCAFLVVAGGLCGAYYILYSDPYRGTVSEISPSAALSDVLTKDEAISEIDYILKRLKDRHPACMHGIPQTVAEQSRIEKDNMPEQVTVLRLWQASSRILAALNDAHTRMGISVDTNNDFLLPISFQFADGRLYCAAGEENAVISIGGIPAEDLYRTFKSQFSHELEGYAAFNFARLCRDKDYLAFMNVDVSKPIVIVFNTPLGEISEIYEFAELEQTQEVQNTPFVYYKIDTDNRIGIFTLTECNFNDIYRETLNSFFADVKSNQIQTVVVDLRENGGGNSMVANEFIRYLDADSYFSFGGADVRLGPILWKNKPSKITIDKQEDLLFHGNVYVLTSSRTFSSATIFAAMISDNGLGKIVGETCGNMPSSYGDILTFQTPNAKLLFNISYKYFHRPDKSKDSLPLTPDYPSAARDALETLYKIAR